MLDGDPMCGEHRIRMTEELDGFNFQPKLVCPIHEAEHFAFWHRNQAIKLADTNPELAAKHTARADKLDDKILVLHATKNN